MGTGLLARFNKNGRMNWLIERVDGVKRALGMIPVPPQADDDFLRIKDDYGILRSVEGLSADQKLRIGDRRNYLTPGGNRARCRFSIFRRALLRIRFVGPFFLPQLPRRLRRVRSAHQVLSQHEVLCIRYLWKSRHWPGPSTRRAQVFRGLAAAIRGCSASGDARRLRCAEGSLRARAGLPAGHAER